MLNTRTLIAVDGTKFWATNEQAQSIATLMETRKGGFARIYGYVATTGRITPTVYDATVTTRFSYEKLKERKRKATEALTINDIFAHLPKDNAKVKAATLDELERVFKERKQSEVDSYNGLGNDAQRDAHSRCYAHISDGVRVHYITAKDSDGLMQPVLTDGFPTADSIMLNCLELSRTVRDAGTYKTVNSGLPVLVGNAIKAALKAQGVRSMNVVSLKEMNFERLAIDGEVVLPEDVIALER